MGAFRHCKAESTSDIDKHGFCVFFNQDISSTESAVLKAIHDNNYVTRTYLCKDKGNWDKALLNHAKHIATDMINYHIDPWAVTHNIYGWPFKNKNHHCTSPSSNTQVIGIEVDSGDIEGKGDDFVYLYRRLNPTEEYNFTVAVNNANRH